MFAVDDRKTHPSPAGGRWRQSDRDYFHRGFGQARHLLPKRHHRASGELHQRRIQRLTVVAALVERRMIRPTVIDRRYSCQTVLPPTIVRTARPFSFQPSNGELRDADWNWSIFTVHSKSGSISVTSAGAPTDNVPALSFNNFAG